MGSRALVRGFRLWGSWFRGFGDGIRVWVFGAWLKRDVWQAALKLRQKVQIREKERRRDTFELKKPAVVVRSLSFPIFIFFVY